MYLALSGILSRPLPQASHSPVQLVASQCRFCFRQLQLCQRKSCCLPSLLLAVQVRDPWASLFSIQALHWSTSLQARRSENSVLWDIKRAPLFKAHSRVHAHYQDRPCKAIHPSLLNTRFMYLLFLSWSCFNLLRNAMLAATIADED